MIIKEDKIDLDQVREVAINLCPKDKHPAFIAGYNAGAEEFFCGLDGILLISIKGPGVYDFDPCSYIDYVYELLARDISQLKISDLGHFIAGIDLAIESSVKTLEFCSLENNNVTAA